MPSDGVSIGSGTLAGDFGGITIWTLWSYGNWCDLEGQFWYIYLRLTSEYTITDLGMSSPDLIYESLSVKCWYFFIICFDSFFYDVFQLLKTETRSLLGHRFLSTCVAKLLLFVAYPEHRRSVSPPLQIRNFSVLSTVEDQSIISQKKSMTKVTFCLCFEQWKIIWKKNQNKKYMLFNI